MVSAASDIDQLKLVCTINLEGGIGTKECQRGSILAQRDSCHQEWNSWEISSALAARLFIKLIVKINRIKSLVACFY